MKNVDKLKGEPTHVIRSCGVNRDFIGGCPVYAAFAGKDSFLKFIEELYLLMWNSDCVENEPGYTPSEVAERLKAYSPAADIAEASEKVDPALCAEAYEHYARWADMALMAIYGYRDVVQTALRSGE